MGPALSYGRDRVELRLSRHGLVLAALLGSAWGWACGGHAERSGSDETSGGESVQIDDAGVKVLFPDIGDASRIRTCAPESVTWVILAYAPEVLDDHRVRTREVHCDERMISERCEFLGEVQYYLEEPNDYFRVDAGVPPERALQIAALSRSEVEGGRLVAVAPGQGGVYLITLARCGAEAQYAVRLKGAGGAQRLEVIETRYNVELDPFRGR